MVSSLEQLADEGDTKAAGHKLAVLTFDFIITLVSAEHILASLVQLSEMLQSKTCDLIRAAREAKVVQTMLQVIKRVIN